MAGDGSSAVGLFAGLAFCAVAERYRLVRFRRKEARPARAVAMLAVVCLLVGVLPAGVGAVPVPPANSGCSGAAVLVKLSVVEDRAAANMLAVALESLSGSGSARCLVDVGDPAAGRAPSAVAVAEAGEAGRVFVVGGPAAVPAAWLSGHFGLSDYDRVAGATRWGTQAHVADTIVRLAQQRRVQAYDASVPSPSTLPANTGCSGDAVAAKLSVVEDRAAANMLAEALVALGGAAGRRCLVDVGDPGAGIGPGGQAAASLAAASGGFVVGGTAAIPSGWLRSCLGVSEAARLSGSDRWATQAAVAAQIVSLARGGQRAAAAGVSGDSGCGSAGTLLGGEVLSAGWEHTCALAADGQVYCWGRDEEGQATPPPGKYVSVAAGPWHSCALRADGEAVCWGAFSGTAVDVPRGAYRAVSAGGLFGEIDQSADGYHNYVSHTCAVAADGTARCWGDNPWGPAVPPLGDTFTSVSTHWSYTCGVRADARVVCWGFGPEELLEAPTGKFASVEAGPWNACAITADRALACWGSDVDGRNDPPSGAWLDVASGGEQLCAVAADGGLACWGHQHGADDSPAGAYTQVAGGGRHLCAVRSSGTVACWGDNSHGQLDAPAGVRFSTR